MTEQEWLECNRLESMLEHLRPGRKCRPSERKFRLFACACCRQVWHFLTDPRSRRAVETAEQYADRLVNRTFLGLVADDAKVARNEVWHQRRDWRQGGIAESAARAATASASWPLSVRAVAQDAAAAVVLPQAEGRSYQYLRPLLPEAEKVQCELLREVVGNPFRPAMAEAGWLTWNDGAVVKLARVLYDDRAMPGGTLDTDRFAVLADALEEAGCTNPDILTHCRGSGPHYRGCWVLDLLLGKE